MKIILKLVHGTNPNARPNNNFPQFYRNLAFASQRTIMRTIFEEGQGRPSLEFRFLVKEISLEAIMDFDGHLKIQVAPEY